MAAGLSAASPPATAAERETEGPGREGEAWPPVVVTATVIGEEGSRPATRLEVGYTRGLVEARLVPLVASPALGGEAATALLDRAAGLVLTGGEDVDPSLYGEPMRGARDVSPERDELELLLLEAALARGLPVLAICRGAQLLNVALGGTLWQDLPTQRPGEVAHDPDAGDRSPDHPIRLEDPALLDGVPVGGVARVNSSHHQGLRELGRGLVAVARAEDGLVEAVGRRVDGGGGSGGGEVGGGRGGEGRSPGDLGAWVVGVQWHPERNLERALNRGLFRRFGREVRRGAGLPAAAAE